MVDTDESTNTSVYNTFRSSVLYPQQDFTIVTMVKAKNGSKKINKKEQREKRTNAVRAKAQAQLVKITKEKEPQTPVIQQLS